MLLIMTLVDWPTVMVDLLMGVELEVSTTEVDVMMDEDRVELVVDETIADEEVVVVLDSTVSTDSVVEVDVAVRYT